MPLRRRARRDDGAFFQGIAQSFRRTPGLQVSRATAIYIILIFARHSFVRRHFRAARTPGATLSKYACQNFSFGYI